MTDYSLPPPTLKATEVDPSEGWLPQGVRNFYKWAIKDDRWARITKAIGPRISASGEILEAECRTLAIAVQAPSGVRAVVVWQWSPTTGKWAAQDVGAQMFPSGEVVTMTVAKGLLETEEA